MQPRLMLMCRHLFLWQRLHATGFLVIIAMQNVDSEKSLCWTLVGCAAVQAGQWLLLCYCLSRVSDKTTSNVVPCNVITMLLTC